MEINDKEIKIRGWQFLLVIVVIISAIAATTIVSINGQKAEVKRVEIEQAEKSDRGHWLWGRWQDVAKDDESSEESK